jgi:hypothetical protein
VKRRTRAVLGIVSLGLSSCAALWGFDDLRGPSGGVTDAGARTDAVNGEDANATSVVFHALDDETKWESFDVAVVNPRARGFHGIVWDKRYVYFVPYQGPAGFHGVVTRYDTAADFADPKAWSTFDVATLNATARGFLGGVFDGRYIYIAPYSNGGVHGNVVRYDTLGNFTTPASWATYDVSNVSPGAKGFFGAVFDGRYVYLIPQQNGAGYDGVVARYDTRVAFTAESAWTTFDIASLDASAVGFFSGTFDGRYLYLCPYKDGPSNVSGRVARYDTQGGFDDPSSWTFFDASQLTTTPDAGAFLGATYDGRAVYFAGSWTARFDPGGRFDDPGSWGIVNTAAVAQAASAGRFLGTTFDTKYLYVASYGGPGQKPVVVRHRVGTDNLMQTEDWSSFDISRVAPVGASAFWGAAFDGRHLYFAPVSDGVVTRFEAVSDRVDLPIPPSFL